MKLYDCHIHSEYSIDGKDTIEDIINTAIKKGVSAITITDHALPFHPDYKNYEHIKKSTDETKRLAEKYKDKILVLSGVERDDEYPPDYLEPFYDFNLDCILGSAHSEPTFKRYFSDCGFKSLKYCADVKDINFLEQVIEKYYERLAGLANFADVDIITHLTFPFRYINGYANRSMDVKKFYPLMDEVLKGIIKTNKTLEVNTSGKVTSWNEYMPNEEILMRYYKSGGRNISLGSDAHKMENVTASFNEASKMLKKIGFTHGSYFIKRKRYEYKL